MSILRALRLSGWLIALGEARWWYFVRAGYNARMTANLTIEQHAELEQHGNQPMPILDPVNQKTYFLVPGELFERLRALLTNEPFDIRETYAAQEAAFSEIWDDPALDVYNDFDDSKLLP